MQPSFLAAEPGFHLGDSYVAALLFVGVAFCVAIGALSHQRDRAFSASALYLLLGAAASVGIGLLDGRRFDPIADALLVERIAEVALVVAVFTSGLKIERRLRWSQWRSVALLIVVVMPVTIALITLFGTVIMGLSLGAALLLGAMLAPTDPVLAGDIGIGAPGEQDEDAAEEPRFAISAEAALNDGLAAPFVLFGLLVAGEGGTGWLAEWVLADVVYAVGVGLAVGALGGYGLAALVVPLREREWLHGQWDSFVALAASLLLYSAAELLGGYGLAAGFVGGVAFRRYEFGHEFNRTIHDGAERWEKVFELTVILLLGSMLTLAALDEPGLTGWLLAPALILLLRPAPVMALFGRSRQLHGSGRLFVAFFGVRGVAAIYYAALVVEAGVLEAAEERVVVWTALACVAVSILVHGVTATPVGNALLARDRSDHDLGTPPPAARANRRTRAPRAPV